MGQLIEKRAVKLAGHLIQKGWRVSRAYEACHVGDGSCAAYIFNSHREYRVVADTHEQALWKVAAVVVAAEYGGRL